MYCVTVSLTIGDNPMVTGFPISAIDGHCSGARSESRALGASPALDTEHGPGYKAADRNAMSDERWLPPGGEHPGPDPWPDRRYTRLLLPGILLLAFALRVIYVLQIRASPNFYAPTMDPLYHTEWARAFAAGTTFQPGPFFRAPLYSWFLGVIFRLFGENLLLPRLIQAGFGTATTALCYLVGREVFDRRAGLIAAFFAATFWVLIYFDGELVTETLGIPLNLVALWLTLRLQRNPAARRALLAGLAWGVSFLVRPNALIFMPFLAGWLIWLLRPSWKRGLAAAGALALGTMLPILPVTAYNWFVGHDLVLISSQGGLNFYIGNNPSSDGCTAVVPGTRSDWWGGYYDSIALAQAAEKRALKPSEVSGYYARQAWDFILHRPGRWIRLMGWKLRLFWLDWELNNNQAIRHFTAAFAPVTRWLPLGFAVIGPFGLLGFLLSLRQVAPRFPLQLFLVGYSAVVIAFFVCSRYRAPVLPVYMIFAAHALLRVGAMVRERRGGALALCAVVLGAAAVPAVRIPAAVDTSEAPFLQDLAISAARDGDDARATELLVRAVAISPTLMDARKNLGLQFLRGGRVKEAEAQLKEAVRQHPDDTVALEQLAGIYLRQNRFEEAIAMSSQLVQRAPAYASGHYVLGIALLQSGRSDEARDNLVRALRLDPGSFESAFTLGKLEAGAGRLGEAERAFRQALAGHEGRQGFDAAYWIACRWLLDVLRQSGKRAEAEAFIESLRRRVPGGIPAGVLG